jgi:hypothetical protein
VAGMPAPELGNVHLTHQDARDLLLQVEMRGQQQGARSAGGPRHMRDSARVCAVNVIPGLAGVEVPHTDGAVPGAGGNQGGAVGSVS